MGPRSKNATHLDESLPIREHGFPRAQGGKNSRNILNPSKLTMHYFCDIKVFGARETLYGIMAGIYHLK
jgi:hypothetical protein